MEVKYAPGFFDDMERLFSPKLRYSLPRFFSDTKHRLIRAWQRARRGYDNHMLWSFHSFMTEHTITAMEYYLSDKTHVVFDKKKLKTILAGFKAAKNIEEDNWPKALVGLSHAYKPSILLEGKNEAEDQEKIAQHNAANAIARKKFSKALKKWHEGELKKFEKGMDAMKEYYFSLWD